MSNTVPDGLSARFWRTLEPRANIRDAFEPAEEWIGSWDNIGLYEGNNKIPMHQTLLIHLTTHRLLILPSPTPDIPHSFAAPKPTSLQCHLSSIRQTELYAGFMRSSPKITIFLGPASPSSPTAGESSSSPTNLAPPPIEERTWTCGVCGTINTLPSHSSAPSPNTPCTLCGVSYAASRASHIPPTRQSTPLPDSTRSYPTPTFPSVPTSGPHSKAPSSPPPDPPPADPSSTTTVQEIACPACTFLNHASMTTCEICGTTLPSKRRTAPTVNVNGIAAESTPRTLDSPGETHRLEVVRLSFRKGGVNDAYKKLKSVLGNKAWESEPIRRGHRPDASTSSSPGTSTPRQGTGAGIDGILQSISLDAKAQDESMASAFQDLEILMVRAGEMVRLAQSLNAKLNALPENQKPSEEEATLIRSSLVQLGLPTPALTPDMVKSDRDYHDGLARELGHLLTGGGGGGGGGAAGGGEGLMVGREGRGVLGLDEVWGLWMRARGVALLSPSSLVAVLPFLPVHTSPSIRSMTLPSGLMVLYSPTYSPTSILARLLALLVPPPAGSEALESSLNIIEIAAHEGLAIGLAKELMEEVEKLRLMPSRALHGVDGVVRDDQAEQGSGGVRWYRDIISIWPEP